MWLGYIVIGLIYLCPIMLIGGFIYELVKYKGKNPYINYDYKEDNKNK